MVPPASHRVSRVLRYSGYCSLPRVFGYRTLTFSGLPSHAVLLTLSNAKCSPQPRRHCCPRFGLCRVRSPLLAVDFSSSPYLDVSVQAVPLIWLWIHHTMTDRYIRRIAPFRYPRIKAYLQLPVAFRSLSRLSSAPSAKAFTLCPL